METQLSDTLEGERLFSYFHHAAALTFGQTLSHFVFALRSHELPSARQVSAHANTHTHAREVSVGVNS